MATFSNGQYFLWSQRTAPASPYTKSPPTGAWTIANFAPHVFSQPPFGTSGGLQALNIRATWQVPLIGAAANRFFPFTPLPRGNKAISGHSYVSGQPVARRLLVFTQPPVARYMGDALTAADGTYSVPNLPSGTYVVLEVDPTAGNQARIYDWIVVP